MCSSPQYEMHEMSTDAKFIGRELVNGAELDRSCHLLLALRLPSLSWAAASDFVELLSESRSADCLFLLVITHSLKWKWMVPDFCFVSDGSVDGEHNSGDLRSWNTSISLAINLSYYQ